MKGNISAQKQHKQKIANGAQSNVWCTSDECKQICHLHIALCDDIFILSISPVVCIGNIFNVC